MEIWKIFLQIVALFICLASAENLPHMTTNSRSSDKQIKMNPTIVYPQDDFNANEAQQASKINSTKTPLGINTAFQHAYKNQSTILGSTFNAKLFETLSLSAQQKNLVFSPLSLQTLLAFIFTMSDGKLYEELSQLLELPSNQAYVSQVFEDILQKASSTLPPTLLIMANKLYYDYHFELIDPSVHLWAKGAFASELEEMDFQASKKAANLINTWISQKTRNLIQNIVTPASITGDTKALLVNSIYFKSEWLIKFDVDDTEIQTFYVSKQRQIPVDMMYNEDVFRYGDFSKDLQASVVELPYNASNLTMLLILPKDADGLAELERKLRFYDLQAMENKLKRETVTVKLPKFEIEYETDMIQTLQKMGLNALFNNQGAIRLFKNQQKPLKVDQFKHKAFINVNEAGTEAAAISVAKYIPLSIPVNMKYFTADHPFVFIIKYEHTILFMGHVAQF